MNMTDKIIEEIYKCRTRDDAVKHYKIAIYMTGIEWRKLNEAIVTKWSVSGLKYIKTKAWK